MFQRSLFAGLLLLAVVSVAPAQRIGFRPTFRPPTPSFTPVRTYGGVSYHPTYGGSASGTYSSSDGQPAQQSGSWWDRWWWAVALAAVVVVIVLIAVAASRDEAASPPAYAPPAADAPPAPSPPSSAETVLVRVTDPPAGEAPDWVRQAWVGLVLPATDNRLVRGQEVLTGRRSFAPAYQVKTAIALALLEVGQHRAAADWWRQNVPDANDPSQHFLFDPACCSPVA